MKSKLSGTVKNSPKKQRAVEDIQSSMVRLRRAITSKALGRQIAKMVGGATLSDLMVVDAFVEDDSHAETDVTVGAIAQKLSIDPSRASRVVASGIRAGYLVRLASQGDGRRIVLRLSPEGRRLLERVKKLRLQHLAFALDSWNESDAADFARLLSRFVDSGMEPMNGAK